MNILRQITPRFLIQWLHFLRALTANIWFGFPGRKLKVIGVTGTNGKTTTCFYIASILEAAGYRVGMATTVNFKIGARQWLNETNMTVISPWRLQKLLAQMKREQCDFAVIETTSHALTQYRVWGIRFSGAVLTNITHEHLDYHKTMEEYRRAKEKLFAPGVSVAAVNRDDPQADYFLRFSAGRHLTFGLSHRAQVMAKKILPNVDGTIFTLVTPDGQATINLKLPGQFNVYNGLAASATTIGLGIKIDDVKRGLEDIAAVPGRMQKIAVPEAKGRQQFTFLIDYAHTPDALEKLYETLRPGLKGHLIVVFGACGDRDKSKRSLMGAIAGRLADIVILTDEEPYTENPAEIIAQIAAGVPRGATAEQPKKEGETFFIIHDREKAIQKAIDIAQKNDIIVLTGMGAQTHRVVGHKHLPWSDKVTAEEALKARFSDR